MPRNPTDYNGHESKRRALRQRVLHVYGPTCWLCGQPIDTTLKSPHPHSYEVDHVTPQSLGGDRWDIDNCRPTHKTCNQSKGNRKYESKTPTPRSRLW